MNPLLIPFHPFGNEPPMPDEGSITVWIRQLKAGDRAAVQNLWETYFQRLVNLTRKMLQNIARSAADEEDVALSAFNSFCCGVEKNRFPQLLDRKDLWQLLLVIAARKVSNLKRHERTQRRGGGNVQHLSALAGSDTGEQGPAFAQLISREPDPEFAAAVADSCRHLLQLLDSEELRSVAIWKMEGYRNEEIALKLDCARATVERRLKVIRTQWEKAGQT
jgi:DNA-directed RNA polymerase specialized sigma24 family protein